MSLSLSALRELVGIGLTAEQILRVAEAQAEGVDVARQRTKAAERQARYEERKRQKASGSVRNDVISDVISDGQSEEASLPLPPSPQTPQPPTPSREYNTPLPPKGRQRRKPEIPLPEGCPSAELVMSMQAEARAAGANADMAYEARQFRDWWLSKDGRNRDWDACWRTWARRQIAKAPKTAVASLAQRQAQTQPEPDRWRRWMREYRQNRYWPKDDAGPAPGAPGCRVPPAVLAEFGINPAPANDPKPDLFARGAAA